MIENKYWENISDFYVKDVCLFSFLYSLIRNPNATQNKRYNFLIVLVACLWLYHHNKINLINHKNITVNFLFNH